MLNLLPLDPAFPIEQQLHGAATPVVLVNLFTVARTDIPALMVAWERDANWMKQRKGFLSTQLHRAVGDSCMFLNYALWDSVDDFRAAFAHPDFVSALATYPSSAVAQPHLFAKVAVPNLCTARILSDSWSRHLPCLPASARASALRGAGREREPGSLTSAGTACRL